MALFTDGAMSQYSAFLSQSQALNYRPTYKCVVCLDSFYMDSTTIGSMCAGCRQKQVMVSDSNMQGAIAALSNQVENKVTTKKEIKMFGFAKEYLDRHKDTVMTVLVALLVDHFFLGGALRGKIKSIIEGILDNAQKKLSNTPNASKEDAS